MTVSGYVTLYKIETFFVNKYFFIIDKMSAAGWNSFAGRIWPAVLSLDTAYLKYSRICHIFLPVANRPIASPLDRTILHMKAHRSLPKKNWPQFIKTGILISLKAVLLFPQNKRWKRKIFKIAESTVARLLRKTSARFHVMCNILIWSNYHHNRCDRAFLVVRKILMELSTMPE